MAYLGQKQNVRLSDRIMRKFFVVVEQSALVALTLGIALFGAFLMLLVVWMVKAL